MRQRTRLAFVVLCTALGACQPGAAPDPQVLTEVEAGKVFAATVATWESQDAAKIKALYASGFAGFNFSGPLVTDRATWDKAQDAYAAAKFDKIGITAKKVQLLGPDAFVVSSFGEDTSSTQPENNSKFRCTDIFMRDAGGTWLIVNENCSSMAHGS